MKMLVRSTLLSISDSELKPAKYILPMVLMSCLLLIGLNQILHVWEFEQTDENRNFAPLPHFNPSYLEVFPKEFDSYYRDAFSFRTPILDVYQRFKLEVLKISPKPKLTLIGSDGWLFNARKEIEIFRGEWDFTEKELIEFEMEWEGRFRILDSLDIETFWYVIPMKHYVYADKLPFNLRMKEPKRVSILSHRLNERLHEFVVDPTGTLRAARDTSEVYYRNDNHWHSKGAHLIAKDILDNLQRQWPNAIFNLPSFSWKQVTRNGGCHANAIGRNELSEPDWQPVFLNPIEESDKYDFVPPSDFPYPGDYEHVFRNQNGNGLKILVIGDSFSGNLRPFISQVFSESVFIFDSWQYGLNLDIILTLKPDVVVFESLETHIDHIIGKQKPEQVTNSGNRNHH